MNKQRSSSFNRFVEIYTLYLVVIGLVGWRYTLGGGQRQIKAVVVCNSTMFSCSNIDRSLYGDD